MKLSARIIVCLLGQILFAGNAFSQTDLNSLYLSGRYDSLITLASAEIQKGDPAPEILSLKALAEVRLGHHSSAIRTLENGTGLYPADLSLKKLLAASHQEAGNMVRAEQAYQQVLALDSLDLSAWLQLARIASFRQDYPSAVYHLRQVLALDSTNLDGLMLTGEALDRLSSSASIMYYAKAFHLYPKNQKAAYALANGYIREEKPAMAVPICRSVLETDTTNIRFNKLLGLAYYRSGKPFEANIYFEDASLLGDSTLFTFKFMGISRYMIMDFHGAAEALRIAVEKDSLDAEIHYILGSSLGNTTEKEAAMYHLGRSLELSMPEAGTVSRIYSEQGNILRLQEKYIESYRHYQMAWEADTTRPLSLYFMASIQDNSLHNLELALTEYERFIKVLDNLPVEEGKEPNQIPTVRSIVEQRIVDIREELFFLDR
jgi:tetratricopeptide (TPR) repeat protein